MNILDKLSVTVVAMLLVLVLPGVSLADTQVRTMELATATKGGGFELFGNTLASVVNATDSPIKLMPVATKGSRQNLELLAQGKVQIGLVEGNAARQALEGIGRDRLDLRVLSVMYPNPGMFVVRADSGYKTIDDLKGRPVAFGTRASGLRILVNDVLNGLDLDPERDFQQIILNKAAEGPAMVLDQKAAALWGAGIGWPGFVKVADSAIGAHFIAPTPTQIDSILSRHPHLRRMTVPAGTYKGQQHAIDSIGLWSLILISPEVSEEVAYELARALYQGEAAMAQKLPQGRFTTARNTQANVDAGLLHAGVIKFFKDQQLLE